ncbi:MAG: lipopolysaccharide biosynthesis protein [Hyphomicrobiaceae bacterium]|nr:lipopolysaccharide biosynthesis protein [Hyphomicrobiaceae bacterium]
MPARSEASPDDIEMSTIFGALRRSLPRLVLWSAAVGALTYGALMQVAPKYQSQAELAIVAKGASSSFADPKTSSPDSLTVKMDKEAINTHVRALQAPELVSKIADELKLKDDPEFNNALGPIDMPDRLMRMVGIGGPRPGESEHDRVLNALFKQIEVYSAKESRFIGVRVSSIKPPLAAEIANHLVEAYRNSLASAAAEEVDEQQTVLKGKIDKLVPEVAAAETEAERYSGEINVFKGGAQNTGLNEQQLSELTGELTKAKSALGEAEARAKSAREMAKAGSADALPDVQKSPLIQNLVQQRVRIERQISELSATLLPGHPRMRQLNADLSGLKRQISGEVAKLVEGLEKEVKVAHDRVAQITASLEEVKSRVVSQAPEEAKLRQLQANAKAKRTELDNLQAQLEANRKRLDTRAQPVEAQVISKALPASFPISPKKGQTAALLAFATLLLGTFWTITRALFDGARSGGASAVPAQEAVELKAEPTLSAKPSPKAVAVAASAKTKAPALSAPASEPGDEVGERSVEEISARLSAATPEQGGFRTLVTGETRNVKNVGRDAIELGKAISASGRQVIVVDWSPSVQSGIANMAGISASVGLSELLSGQATFGDIVQRVPESRVHFICSGAPIKQVDKIDPDQLNLVLDALDEAYDHIIVAGAHDDARMLFETIEGRFDAGILLPDPKKKPTVLQDAPGTFLGFEVAGIDILTMSRAVPAGVPTQRLLRATRKVAGEAA